MWLVNLSSAEQGEAVVDDLKQKLKELEMQCEELRQQNKTLQRQNDELEGARKTSLTTFCPSSSHFES